MKPRALDLFCGAGGATKGLQRAGFHVTGVDIRPQPNYCGEVFLQGDALTFPLDGFDFIWASPPCQAFSTVTPSYRRKDHPNHIPAMRARLDASGVLYCMENVPGAPLRCSVLMCGSGFGLKVRRHRILELSFLLDDWSPRCRHQQQGSPIDVSGTGARRITRKLDDHGGSCNKPRNLAEAREAIGIDWMNRYEISQAIPPVYSEFIGKQALSRLEAAA